MKKAVAFLLAFLIFVAPVTTLVKADVVIGDNDETIINENATILGRKLALLESFSDLALSGVTEFTISNTNDVDTYLDYLWNEVDDAIESLSNGNGFQEISNNLKSKYYTNLIQYRDYIVNRGDYLAHLLPSGSPTTTLLSTFFADNIYPKVDTNKYDLALDMFRSLSALTNDEVPRPDTDYSYYTNKLGSFYGFYNSGTGQEDFYILNNITRVDSGWSSPTFDDIPCSVVTFGGNINGATTANNIFYTSSITLNIANTGNTYYLSCSGGSSNSSFTYNGNRYNSFYQVYPVTGSNGYLRANTALLQNCDVSLLNDTFNNLTDCLSYCCQHFRYVNLYVDGVPWVIVGAITNPTLDIDGFLKIYGNDTPQEYELQPNTQIDYNQLYQVIYNAIRDNLPISQGDINYYDSHDTIYSPTIINNYGEEEGNESDLIDTILNYAIIPKFDTAIAQPMRSALTNGVLVMNTSITNVIPDEILLVLGACFFLLLFAVVINRMIK